VDASTISPAAAAAIAAAVRAKGARFLEAPVSGSKGPAEQGALIFLTAGACVRVNVCVCWWRRVDGRVALGCGWRAALGPQPALSCRAGLGCELAPLP
jgi:hypothetical protein